MNSDFLLYLQLKICQSIGMSATLGYNLFSENSSYNSAYITNSTILKFYSLSNSTEDPRAADYLQKYRKKGIYGVVDFDYNDWLFLGLQARNDWSSTLPEANNSFFYPAVTLAADLTEVLELDKDVFSFVKLRASLAQAGNDATPYKIFPVFTAAQATGGFASTSFPIGGVSAFENGDRIGNENLQPEISTEWEIGGDFRLFHNRLGIDVAYFNKTTNNQIISKELDPTTGYTSQTVNLGEISNKGIELLVNAVPLIINDFEWGVNFNYSKIKNNVVSIGEASEDGNSIIINTAYDVELRVEEGLPIGAIYAPTAMTDDDGNIVVNPSNGLPLTAPEKKYMGSINPDFTLGFGTSLKYKAFKLSTNFDYRKGGVFYSYTARLNYFVGNAWNSQYNDREPFIVPGSVNILEDGTVVENTRQVDRSDIFTYWGATDAAQENHVLDRTFLKMRNISLEYILPKSLCSKIGINKGVVFLHLVEIYSYGHLTQIIT
ncbi:MAG: TonB-dependent receptor [Saprospiraceae bacterium]